jgi:hypothetical protein
MFSGIIKAASVTPARISRGRLARLAPRRPTSMVGSEKALGVAVSVVSMVVERVGSER